MTEHELLTSQWRLVAAALEIQFVGPFELPLAEGDAHRVAVLFPQFGNSRGMLIDAEYDREAANAAGAAGFGHSTMGAEHSHLPVDPSTYIDCLVEWGWSSSSEPPSWYGSASHDA